MFKYIKKYSLASFLGLFFKFTEAVFELMLPLVMVRLIDVSLQANNSKLIKQDILTMLALTIFGYLASITCQIIASYVGQKIAGELREDLYIKTREFNLEDFRKYSVEALMNRFTIDVIQVQDMVAKTIRLAVRAPILMIGSLFAMYRISPELSLTLLKTFPLMILLVFMFMYLSLYFYKQNQQKIDKLLAKSKEMLEGMRIVRAYNQEDREYEGFINRNKDLKQTQKKVSFVSALSNPLTNLLMNFVLVLLVYKGALQIDAGNMTQGQIVAIINYCTQLVLSLIVFMNLILIFSRGIASSNRIMEVLNEENKREEGILELNDENGIAIEFIDASFYDPITHKVVLDNLNFKIEPYENIGIFGLTGSGKTSLAQLLFRNFELSKGQILLNGEDIRAYKISSLHSKMSYVSQEPMFLNKSIEDNVLLNKEGSAQDALYKASADEIVDKGLDTLVEEYGRNFSGGQRQRIHLARAFADNKSLLLLDDSLGGLDNQTSEKVFRNIMSNKNQQKILISQKYKDLASMSRVICLEEGRLVDFDSPKELLKNNKNFKLMHDLQLGGDLTYE